MDEETNRLFGRMPFSDAFTRWRSSSRGVVENVKDDEAAIMSVVESVREKVADGRGVIEEGRVRKFWIIVGVLPDTYMLICYQAE